MTTPSEVAHKKPWYKKAWIWIIVGALIVIGGIANLVNPRPSDDAQPSPSESAVIADGGEESPAAVPEADETETGATVALTSAEFEASIKRAFGGVEFSDLHASDPTLWAGYIAGVRVERSNAFVTLQVAADDPARKELGDRAAKALSTLLTADDVDGIAWIIVEDASGTVIAQQQPKPIA